jgi:hypothetical protein
MNNELISIFDAIRNAYHKIINSTNLGFLVKIFLASYGILALAIIPIMIAMSVGMMGLGFMGALDESTTPITLQKLYESNQDEDTFSFLPEPFGTVEGNQAVLGTDVTQDIMAPIDEGALPPVEDYEDFYNVDPAEYYNPENYKPDVMPVPPFNRVVSPNGSPEDFRAPYTQDDPFGFIAENPVFLLFMLLFVPVVAIGVSYLGSVTYLAAKSVQTGNEVRVMQLLRNAKNYLWKYLVLMFLLQLVFMLVGVPTLIFVIVGALLGDLATGLFVFLGILYAIGALSFVAIKTMFAIYVLFHEDKGAVDSIKESFELTKGYFWNLFGKGFVYVLFSMFIIMPIFFFVGNQYLLGGAGGFLIGMFTILVMYEIYLDLKRLGGAVSTGEVSTSAASDDKSKDEGEDGGDKPAEDDLK